MKASRLVERLKEVMGTIEVEPPVSVQASTPRVQPSSPFQPRFQKVFPADAADAAYPTDVQVALRLRGVQAGWLAAGVPRSDPQFARADRLSTQTARILSARLVELSPAPVDSHRLTVGSRRKIIFEAGEEPPSQDPPAGLEPLLQALVVDGRSVGYLQAVASPRLAGLLEAAARILADRLEVLVLQSRLQQAEAQAEALRARLQQLAGK